MIPATAIFSHVSAEAGRRMLLDELGLVPLADLNIWLGEASGAAWRR
jgi:NaMN:DMB phosphoribosyltransferase